MEKEIKFTHCMGAKSIPKHIRDCLAEQPSRSGMYNWIQVFKGEINTFEAIKDRLNDYDIIQVNMTPSDLSTIKEIRRRLGPDSKTKLVINNDYVCEYWGKWGVDPYVYDDVQRCGDMVFGTEEHQVSNMINGTFVIPHPTNTAMLKKCTTDVKDNAIGFLYHWWAGSSYLPFRTVNKVKQMFGVKKCKIYGYNPEADEMRQFKTIMWDEIVPLLDFPDFLEAAAGQRVLYDPNPFHTYGRNGVEMACMRKPIIGSDRVFSYRKLFPELCCDPYDMKTTMEKFDLVLNNPEKVKEITDRAYEEVEYFNYENSRVRFLNALDIATERGGHKFYQQQT